MTGYVPHEKDTEYFTLISKSAAQRAKETLGDANAPYCLVLPATAWQIIENEIYSTMLEEFQVSGRVEIETEIPADVMEEARNARERFVGDEAKCLRPWSKLDEEIARAIMAERERCAMIADEKGEHWDSPKGYEREACNQIADAIRLPPK